MKIKQTPIDELIPYASNSRTHSDEQVAQIAASIKEFGFNNPVLLDKKNGIIAGHGRVLAARKLGLKEVPTIELSHLTENQRKAYIIADNKLALNSGWDMDLLSLEMGDLKKAKFDLSLLGFDASELNLIFEGMTDSDDIDDIDEIDESCNFIIKCEDIAEREMLKSRLNITSDKIAFDKFLQCLPS